MAHFDSILFERPLDVNVDDLSPPRYFADLVLDRVVAAVVAGYAEYDLDRFYYAPLRDVAAIAYRHEVFRDLQGDELRRPFDEFVSGMSAMRRCRTQAGQLRHPLQQQRWFLAAATAFCDAVVALRDGLADTGLSARGLRGFADYLGAYADGEPFHELVADTAAVQRELDAVRYTVLVDGPRVHVDKFAGQADYSADVAEVFARFRQDGGRDYRVQFKDWVDMNHVEEQVLDCVARNFTETFELLAGYCTRHRDFLDPTIARFDREIHFYLAYLEYMRRFTDAGLAFGYPDVSADFGGIEVDGGFDIALADTLAKRHESVVCNDFHLDRTERILVVTGPNQGGKTTFARMFGQLAHLASLGCPVPASRARLMLPDRVFTHFERQESLATLHGKLDDELVRIHDILSNATGHSIIVMNESFSSTTVNDALLIGSEVLERIIALGCLAVYVTFLDELAALDPTCVSMVGEVAPDDPAQRTFVLTRRPADGRAYADALARRYGLTYEALSERIGR